MPRLGVNIDHVATLREVRGGREPDPVWAAVLAELGGADVITIHLREDRRHIQDRDLRLLRQTVQVRLNMELAVEPKIIDLALEIKPEQATLVPERRLELTTEGGLDVVGQRDRVQVPCRACTIRGSRYRSLSTRIPDRSRPRLSLVPPRSSFTLDAMPTHKTGRNGPAS